MQNNSIIFYFTYTNLKIWAKALSNLCTFYNYRFVFKEAQNLD